MKGSAQLITERSVRIELGSGTLSGDLDIPAGASGLVVFAHGSGSSRLSPRNRFVARALGDAGMGTLLMDLLTEREDRIDAVTGEFRFNIPLLSERLTGSVDWVKDQPDARTLPLGIFGASTGAAAALVTAAQRPDAVLAVVSRGGRPDMAEEWIPRVQAPTLLIVGGEDYAVIELNRDAFAKMNCEKKIEIIPGATHLFEEPGALEDVARLAAKWFQANLSAESEFEGT